MIVTCPNCSTRYQLDAQVLVPHGRALRCVKCGHTWTERPKTDAAPVEDDETDDVEVPDFGLDVPARQPRGRTPAAARRRERGRASRSRKEAGSGLIGWAVLGILVVGVAAGLFFLRAGVVAYFPAAKPAYDMIGLDTAPRATVPGEGLKILKPSFVARDDGDTRVIDIEGEVQNITRSTRAVPQAMQVLLLDQIDNVVGEWKFRAPVSLLGPLDKFQYRTSVIDPPADAASFRVVWVTQVQE
jgi:predicted Zn finger-like uncharacterized protein